MPSVLPPLAHRPCLRGPRISSAGMPSGALALHGLQLQRSGELHRSRRGPPPPASWLLSARNGASAGSALLETSRAAQEQLLPQQSRVRCASALVPYRGKRSRPPWPQERLLPLASLLRPAAFSAASSAALAAMGFTSSSFLLMSSLAWVICVSLPVIRTTLYPISLVSWLMLTLAPLAASTSRMPVPLVPTSRPTHCCSTANSAVWLRPGLPPTLSSVSKTRSFAACTDAWVPVMCTMLYPRDLVPWSILTCAPVSASTSRQTMPPLPSTQPTHFCSICSCSEVIWLVSVTRPELCCS
mmetsp:Transcript_95576/g.265542  ORF Transcript_95576/g.265542 Transcript_95576/m.265542 type:complete len:299 (+) Transcript_95576:133-1029(+)